MIPDFLMGRGILAATVSDLESFLKSYHDSRVALRERFPGLRMKTSEQGSKLAMPYMPYWFESFGPFLPWVVPCLALSGLWTAKCSASLKIQKSAERIYFAAMLLVSWVALRTILANDGCWLIHMASIGAMVLGATYPAVEISNSDLENEIMFY